MQWRLCARNKGTASGGAEKHPNPKLTARSASLAVRSYVFDEKDHQGGGQADALAGHYESLARTLSARRLPERQITRDESLSYLNNSNVQLKDDQQRPASLPAPLPSRANHLASARKMQANNRSSSLPRRSADRQAGCVDCLLRGDDANKCARWENITPGSKRCNLAIAKSYANCKMCSRLAAARRTEAR